MKKFTTILMGLSLLVVSCIGFLGCSDNNAPTITSQANLGTPAVTTATTAAPAAGAAADSTAIADATVQPPANVPSGVAIGSSTQPAMTFATPQGYALSVPANSGLVFTNTATGNNVSGNAATSTLPLIVLANGNVQTAPGAIAELPQGNLTVTLPTITMTPTTAKARTRATGGTGILTIKGVSVNFTVTNGNWSIPSSYTFRAQPLTDGYFQLSGAICNATWTTSTAPTQVNLANVTLSGVGSAVTLASKTIDPVTNNTVSFTSTNTNEFSTISGAVFTFTLQ